MGVAASPVMVIRYGLMVLAAPAPRVSMIAVRVVKLLLRINAR